MVPTESPPDKGDLRRLALRERMRPVALPSVPGDPLGDTIFSYAHEGRGGWDLGLDLRLWDGELVVPRIPEFPRGNAATAHAVWSVEHAGEVLRPRLALALESRDHLAWKGLDDRDHAELKKLRAATARDIVGLNGEQLAAAFTYTDESTVRAKVREGRRLLRGLGAWPWCAFHDGAGRPPREWRTLGDPCASALLAWWVSPDLLSWAGDALAYLD